MTTTTPLSEAPFIAALQALDDNNEMLHDFWISELCGDGDALLADRLTERNLQLIEHDVMQQLSINGALR
jgi:hypothetical protein